MTPRFLSILFLIGASLCSAKAEETLTYVNPRFGFSLTYPANLTAGPPPANGDGRHFASPDGELSVRAFGHFLVAESFDEMWASTLENYGAAVTYKVKRDDWFVVSGVLDGTEFYHKVFVQGGNACHFIIEYPHARNAVYDPVVEQIAKDFVPFLDGDYDRAPAP